MKAQGNEKRKVSFATVAPVTPGGRDSYSRGDAATHLNSATRSRGYEIRGRVKALFPILEIAGLQCVDSYLSGNCTRSGAHASTWDLRRHACADRVEHQVRQGGDE